MASLTVLIASLEGDAEQTVGVAENASTAISAQPPKCWILTLSSFKEATGRRSNVASGSGRHASWGGTAPQSTPRNGNGWCVFQQASAIYSCQRPVSYYGS